jgi:hypothetical protein
MPKSNSSKHPLVGKFFHSLEADRQTIKWQGQIKNEVGPGIFLVQLFDYLMGAKSNQVIIPVSEMAFWPIYDTDAEMREAFERHTARKKAAAGA